MKHCVLFLLLLISMFLIESCAKKLYITNGETIYFTGNNKKGEHLLDKANSQITFINGCKGCHGKNGGRNINCTISWAYLTTSPTLTVPYTDSLFFRFMDTDVKSDGTVARTGVHWKMADEDKKDLIAFLKTLK